MGNSISLKNSILTEMEKDTLVESWIHSSNHHHTTNNKEKEFIIHVKEETAKQNVDNVTRTNAYWEFYIKHPEVHWAFLAHMVSRNGGWNMTDLKGSIVPNFIPYNQASVFFSFLEKANFLIFHDAYPQLLLYEQSKLYNKSLFHLLPSFGVSSFMKPIWKLFLQHKCSEMLTYALIINEQSYLEQRVILNPFYQAHVMQTISFALQERLGLTNVVFPYYNEISIRLAGVTVTQFSQIKARVHVGKKLYNILFQNELVFEGANEFARKVTHSGSRSDYLPDIFSSSKTTKKIHSPTLHDAWNTYTHPSPKMEDWFKKDLSILHLFEKIKPIDKYDITDSYMQNLLKLTSLGKIKDLLEKI